MTDYTKFGYANIAVVSPKLFLAQPEKNKDKIIEIFKQESKKGNIIVSFTELGITGYSCEDLFHTEELLESSNKALSEIIKATINIPSFLLVGHPYQTYDGKLYNCASIIYKGKLLAMIPKTHIPNYSEFYELRHFSSGLNVDMQINDFGQSFKLSSQQLINFNNKIIFGTEICEDLWAPISVSTNLCMAGANLILNLSASNELVNKHKYRKELVTQQSARLYCAYAYSSASVFESTKDMVFGGATIISSCGTLLSEGKRFSFEDEITTATIDFQRISYERRKNTTFGSSKPLNPVHIININGEYSLDKINIIYPQTPFVPNDPSTLVERSEEIIQIQSTGLARRMLTLGKPKLVLGLSGGLDSTLGLIIAMEAVKKLQQPFTDIICISMPGFGTSDRTKGQSHTLAKACGVTFSEIDIKNTVLSHFNDIGHDPAKADVVYENAQSRERMRILLGVANSQASSGLVINTGNLSEACLGFMSLAGDQTGHYAVNSSIPKTLVKNLIKYYKDHRTDNNILKQVLQDVIDTKISPELLPLDKDGNIEQQTEEIVGPYILIDNFIYYYLRFGFSQEKILAVTSLAFEGIYAPDVIEKWMKDFFRRFKANQFKRSILPAGPKVGVSVSPRADWRSPEDQ